MAKQILRIEGKTDYARGITCNVGLVRGGTGAIHGELEVARAALPRSRQVVVFRLIT